MGLPQSNIDWARYMEGLQDKVNTDHTNDTKPYLKITYVNRTSGYRIWSDGYCEQWGTIVVPSDGSTTVTYLKEMNSTDYLCLCNRRVGFDIAIDAGTAFYPKDTKAGIIMNGARGNQNFNWCVAGYLAEGEY